MMVIMKKLDLHWMKKAVESTNHDASNNEKPKKKTKDIKKKLA